MAARLVLDHGAPDQPRPFQKDVRDQRVEMEVHTGFQGHLLSGELEEFRIVADRCQPGVDAGRALLLGAPDPLQPDDQLVPDAPDDLLLLGTRGIEAAESAHQRGGRQAAEETVALHQNRLGAGTGRSHCGGDAGAAPPDDEHIAGRRDLHVLIPTHTSSLPSRRQRAG